MALVKSSTGVNLKNSTYNSKNGRYVLGGTAEVSSFALEWWSKTDLARDPSDLVYFMEKKYEGRPELLGYLFYGDPGLWWVIAQYNTIIDPFNELVEGKMLLIPLKDRVQQAIFNSKAPTIGGVPSTR